MRKWIWMGLIGLSLIVVVVLCALAPYRLGQANPYLAFVRDSATRYGLSPALLLAVANAESGFDPQSVSSAGAVGLMQLMPSTARWICGVRGISYTADMLLDPAANVDLGAWYMLYLLDRFELSYAICAYNAGEGVVAGWQSNGIEVSDVPYSETRAYVRRVLSLYRGYMRLGYK